MNFNCKDVEKKLLELHDLLSKHEPSQDVIDFLEKLLLNYKLRKSTITYSDGSNDCNNNVMSKER